MTAMSNEKSAVWNECLPPGMTEQGLREAVEHSGFPLQTVVASVLSGRHHHVSEEWAWVDPDTGAPRTLDVVGVLGGESNVTEGGSAAIAQSLLVECKQSRNPYLGFVSAAPPTMHQHPTVMGLKKSEIDVGPQPSQGWHRIVPVLQLLSMEAHAFHREPPLVSSLSRAHPKGKHVEISGDEPFNSLIRPLSKASRKYREHWHDPNVGRDKVFNIRLVFPIAVIDAPILVVRGQRGASEIEKCSWFRAINHHAVTGRRDPWSGLGFDAIDVVSADFLEEFLDAFLTPFVDEFRRNFEAVQDILLSGKASLPGLARDAEFPSDAMAHIRAAA